MWYVDLHLYQGQRVCHCRWWDHTQITRFTLGTKHQEVGDWLENRDKEREENAQGLESSNHTDGSRVTPTTTKGLGLPFPQEFCTAECIDSKLRTYYN